MSKVTVRFDEIARVSRDGGWTGRNYWPRQTVFSFMSDFKYFPYVAAPGWPEIREGLTVTALLEKPGDWKSMLGWVNHDSGEIAAPNPVEYMKQAGVDFVYFLLGVTLIIAGAQQADVLALAGTLFTAFMAYDLLSVFKDWRKAKITRAALKCLAAELRLNTAVEPGAQERPLATLAPVPDRRTLLR